MKKAIKIIGGIVLALVLLGYFFGGGLEEQVAKDLQKIENQVAEDAVKQYEIAKRSGSDMDAYIQAGLAATAFLQAKDEENYKKWKKIEAKEAKNIGL